MLISPDMVINKKPKQKKSRGEKKPNLVMCIQFFRGTPHYIWIHAGHTAKFRPHGWVPLHQLSEEKRELLKQTPAIPYRK
jgi:hypothetical protein